jgi:HEPN domain-containing protein
VAGADDASYRLRLAAGFLDEAEDDAQRGRWRSCVDNSQLAAENAVKTYLALLGPSGRTHRPAALLRRAIADGTVPPHAREIAGHLAEAGELLGPDIHARSDYGDEAARRTPWELFDEATARECLDTARQAVGLARQLTDSSAS